MHRSKDNQDRWVSPFGNLWVKGCSHLTKAYRSVPRPSSPVCAKASTNCPYLTLESPHHQRQRWVDLSTNQNSAEQRSHSILMRMIKNAQPNNLLVSICAIRPRGEPRHLLVQTDDRYGIDFKNPFTMSNTRSLLLSLPPKRNCFLFIIWILVSVVHPRARQSQQSCALWARFAALAGLGGLRISFANSSRLLRLGGAYRDRTDDLMLAKQPLSQLS